MNCIRCIFPGLFKSLLFLIVCAVSKPASIGQEISGSSVPEWVLREDPTINISEPLELDEDELTDPSDREDAIEVTPARAAMYEGMVHVQDGLYEEGIRKLEWAIEQDPTLIGGWETLGWAYWLTDRRQDAESLWNRLVVIAPNEPMGYNLLAQVATRDGDFDRAQELYETSLRLNPDQYETRLNLARVLLWGGDHVESARILRRLFREDSDRIDVEIELAWALYISEAYEESLEHWNHINEMIPDNPMFLLARANVLVLIGALDEADADARYILEELDPRNVDALNMLATLATKMRQPEEVVAALEQLIDYTEDEKAKARIALRIAQYKKGLLDSDSDLYSRRDILRRIRTALDYDDRYLSALLFYGEMLIVDRQYARAENVFNDILEEYNPHLLRARFGLLESYFGRAMYDEAEQQLRDNFGDFNANNPFRHLLWARLYFAQGNFLAALDSLERLEYEGSHGSVFTLLYHGISPSEFSDMPSVRQLQEHLMSLRRAGFRFITPSELPLYFEQKQPANLADDRPWLNRTLQSIRYSWSGRRPEKQPRLADYTPDKVVMVTFDDGMRNSFRYGTQVAEDLGIRMTMFVGVGDVLSPTQRYVASFPEIREFNDTGLWEIHSHLWDAHELTALDEDGEQLSLPIANQIWLPERERRETLREYQARLRREFRDSQRVLARELHLDKSDIFAVAYPYGEVGQEMDSNIRAFRVPEVVLNEAEISYKMGFIQFRNGYTMKRDDHMLYKRWEPPRMATGRDVLREAYRQHPVFIARRMRAEMAALNGRLHMAMENIELLKRDGYPEEDLAELNEYVRRHLARLAQLPETVEDITVRDEGGEPRISLRRPYIGVEGSITRANEMIDDREGSLFAGINLNRRSALQLRAGGGRIRQTVTSNTFVEVQQRSVESVQSTERRVEDGVVQNVQITRNVVSTRNVQSNVIVRTRHRADRTFVGGALSYTHRSGSFTMADVRYHMLDGPDIGNDEAWTYGIEHQWRPVMAIDLAARYHHGLVPSARQVIEYDSVAVRPFWRIRDYWHANGLAYFAYYDDNNSHLKAEIENYWCISEWHDIWLGLRNSVDTVDRDSDLYWTPFWDQRHAIQLRIRRSYPDYFGMFRVHFGYQKSEARREERDRFAAARALGEAQGWSPGSGPERGWQKMIGFAGSVTRTFQSGLEVSGEFSVNSSDEYTEHGVLLRCLYMF